MDLRDYLSVVRHRAWIIAIAVASVVAVAVLLTAVETRVYEAHARILLEPSKTVFEASTGASASPVRAQTEIEIIKSAPVRDLVRKRLGYVAPVSATSVVGTDVIDVASQNAKPSRAADVANAYSQAYIDYRRDQAVNALLAAGEQIRQRVADLQKQIDDKTAAANDAFAQASANQKPGGPAPTIPATPDRDALVSQQALLKERLDQLQVDAALKDGGASLVAPATAPTTPVRPRPVHNVLLALGVGIVLGLAAAFVADHLDDSIKSGDDLESAGGGISLLGVIPAINWKNKTETRVVSLTEPTAPAAEAYRTLRTSITFLALDRSLGVIQLTSPNSAEGKTTTLANLAVAMAKTGQRVLIIDCDLRRPRIHEFFEVSNAVGFTSVLMGSVSLAGALHEINPHLRLLTAGPRPTNPSELLSSNRTSQLFKVARAQTDFVLIDSPPVLPVTDAAVLSAKVDGTILVANAGQTSTKDYAHALDLLRKVDAPLIGGVLNGVTSEGGYGAYRYDYSPLPANGTRNGNGSANGNGSDGNGAADGNGATDGKGSGSRAGHQPAGGNGRPIERKALRRSDP
jgi:capsular exopolysaccharide synthesis family protein